MCRILVKTNIGKDQKLFASALAQMKRGGPDATHIYEMDDIAFGHNRLSIIDVRSIADQPMVIDGNVLLFNGEIYNHAELKREHNLETRTTSDTEVILLLYNLFGNKAFSMLDGEFAIVIYDPAEEKIKVVRDRIGIKQLYYSNSTTELIVSSEIKGILPFLGDPVMNETGFDDWLCYGHGESSTMFEDVNIVDPNTILEFDKDGYLLETYDLNLPLYQERGNEKLFMKIARAVGKRMMSDVPISCTLSGGLDSSIVAYVMSEISDSPIKTYTIGFEGCENEFEQARKVAEFIKSDHTQIEIPFSEILNEIDNIIETMEEPIDRGSLIPTYFLAKNIKEKVTLIGEGADEVYAGYSRHKWLMDNPNKEFEEYFDTQLRAFESNTSPDMYDVWEDKNAALKFDLEHEIPNFHTLRIDKCMMRFGVEARVPFLDPEITSTLFDVPFKDKQNPEKRILREAFRDVLPEWILKQPKKALKLPFAKIVKLPEVEKLILEEHDLFDKELISELYSSIETNKHSARNLWNIFLFKKWQKKYLE